MRSAKNNVFFSLNLSRYQSTNIIISLGRFHENNETHSLVQVDFAMLKRTGKMEEAYYMYVYPFFFQK